MVAWSPSGIGGKGRAVGKEAGKAPGYTAPGTVHLIITDPDAPGHDDTFTRCCGINWRVLANSGLITAVPMLVTCPGRQRGPASANARKRIDQLRKGDRVRMYRTVVEITGPWKAGGNPGETWAEPGWGRLPIVWDGVKCAPPERGDMEVEVVQ